MNQFTKIYNQYLKPLAESLKDTMCKFDKEIFTYKSYLRFKDVFYTTCLINGNPSPNHGYSKALDSIKENKLFNVTKSALITKKKRIDHTYYDKISEKVIEHIYKDVPYRLLGNDGSFIYYDISLKKDGCLLSNNKECCIGLVNVLHDLERKIIINYSVHNLHNEREALISQFHLLRVGDIVVHDRGYPSVEIFIIFNQNHIKGIWGLPNTSHMFKAIKKSRKNDIQYTLIYKNQEIKLRLLKYKIDTKRGKKNIYLVTNILDEFDIDFFIDAYKKRWEVEVNIRHAKYDLPLANIKAKTFHGIQQDVSALRFNSIMSSYIEYLLTPKIKKTIRHNHKINTSSCIDMTVNKILKSLFYPYKDLDNKQKIVNQLFIISQNVVMIQKGRSCKRKRRRPLGKWRNSGGSSNRPRKKKLATKKVKSDDIPKYLNDND